ncbi:MAG: FtsX-like permease family protein, partial [Myxococcota bacterium]|nr:FtsX-like permease family protein [Myxococcota bacterium]MDW8364160.1 FtsX-like permease family protein [Myxococcales bacterium]
AQSASTRLISLFVAISATFGIASVLAVSVVQRTREIGILRAVGVSRAQVRRMFLLMGALVGFLGALLGSLLAGALIAAWQQGELNRSARGAFALDYGPGLFLAAVLLATVVGMLAAMLPARRAAALDPVEALRQ